MGIASYIINRNELKQIIKDALNNIELKSSIKNFSLGDLTVEADTSEMEGKLNGLIKTLSLQTISINKNLMSTMNFYSIFSSNNDNYNKLSNNITNTILLLYNKKQKIKEYLTQINNILDLESNGKPNAIGFHWYISNSINDFTMKKIAEKNLLMIGIVKSQDNFNYLDSFDMKINNNYVIKNMYDKYSFYERKNFLVYYIIYKNDVITFTFHNKSGTERNIGIDLEYLDLSEDLFNAITAPNNIEYDIKDE